ncbi:MAG TPA: hypothetical protein VI790_06215, partial [Candidatus Nanoarchaeia archaeon]|nr:hypothetical protein [Candidatus Nanoarchaeia archaeon]
MDYVKGGVIAVLATLAISMGIAGAPITQKDVTFNISIQKDASISISNICLADGEAMLRFEPGINGLGEDPYALAKNACTDEASVGYWNVTNIGNLQAYMYVKLNETLTGITVAVGDQNGYVAVNYINLTATNTQWVESPLARTANTKFWQRIAADATATGGSERTLKVIVTSFPE